jgi:hypothetical protein
MKGLFSVLGTLLIVAFIALKLFGLFDDNPGETIGQALRTGYDTASKVVKSDTPEEI